MSTVDWATVPCLGFDLESTGINAHTDRIVQAAVVSVKPDVDPVAFTWLADPGVEIPDEAAAVHGITTEKARAEGQDVGQVLFELTGRLALWLGKGYPIAGFNLAYDLTMLEAENKRHGIDTLASRLDRGIGPVIDAMVLDRHADPYRKGICAQDRRNPCQCGAVDKKLTSLCLHYGVQLDDAHDAGADALAAARLWPRVVQRHAAQFRGFTIGGLHQGQIKWRREQLASLKQFHEKQGKAEGDYCGEWPLHRTCAPALVGGA